MKHKFQDTNSFIFLTEFSYFIFSTTIYPLYFLFHIQHPQLLRKNITLAEILVVNTHVQWTDTIECPHCWGPHYMFKIKINSELNCNWTLKGKDKLSHVLRVTAKYIRAKIVSKIIFRTLTMSSTSLGDNEEQ